MSLSQLNDPSMREALGVEDTPEGEPTLAYTNNGTTSTLQVGAAINTVPITSVPILNYDSTSTVQVSPLPIDIRIDPPNASPLNDVRVAEFHWIKQDPNNQDKLGYFQLGDGFFKIGAEWVGFGPQTVALEGGNVAVTTNGTNNGSIGLDLIHNGNAASGRFWVDNTGQLTFNHILPNSSSAVQPIFFPTYCEAISTASTAVGGSGQVLLPFSSVISTSSQGGVNHFGVSSPTTLQYTGINTGLFFVTATIGLDTATGGTNTAVAHFKKNTVDVSNSATRHSINQNGEQTVVIQSFIQLSTNDIVSVALSSTDAAMTATNYPAVVGPPTIPAQPAMVLVATRIA